MLSDPENGQYFKRLKWLFIAPLGGQNYLCIKQVTRWNKAERERQTEEPQKKVSKRSAAIIIKKGDPVEAIWRGVIGT